MSSLSTDSIFVTALQSNEELMETLGFVEETQSTAGEPARLYGTAIPMPDDDAENVPVPYIIVTFDGLNNDTETKENLYEGDYDHVSIGVDVAAKTLEDLYDLTQAVRDTILGYFRETETAVEDYSMSADAIQYDSWKPCYWQTLRYQCNVNNLTTEENEQD